MRWLLIIGGTLGGLVALVITAGYALPVKHVASVSIELDAPPERVWETITDVTSFSRWRKDVKSVEIVQRTPAGPVWRERSSDGTITYETVESVPQRRLISRISDRSLPFGGTWTFDLAPTSSGTQLTIREDGEVYNPVFRFASRFVLGHDATIKKYIADLEAGL
ncbi:MAG: SRPBCC family protein [Gemmatimonadaceae bacterium]